jgi:nucleoside-diphosphate-sugar epimerase
MERFLVTGAAGQIGSELVPALRERYGRENVIASDVDPNAEIAGPFTVLDVCDRDHLEAVVEEHDIDGVFHLAALLSAVGERDPWRTYRVNVDGLNNVLAVSDATGVDRVVVPSSIAVFGTATPDEPEEMTVYDPRTMYGISKVVTELLGYYHSEKGDLDVRGVRFPGLLSYGEEPGGGTTDYAVEAFYSAVASEPYTYFVRPDTRLPMMYMPDAIRALLDLAEAPEEDLRFRCRYNVSAFNFTAAELTEAIRERVGDFEVEYRPDHRQAIADSWPETVDDSAARRDWGWRPEYGFEATVDDMLANLSESRLREVS